MRATAGADYRAASGSCPSRPGETEKTVAVRGDGAGEEEPPRLRLISTNPDSAPCSCFARDVRNLGKVLWVVRWV